MEELLSVKTVVTTLLGVIMALLAWIGRRELKRIESDIRLLDARVQSDVGLLRSDMERRHDENTEKLDNIVVGVTGTHRRIDDLYRDILNKIK